MKELLALAVTIGLFGGVGLITWVVCQIHEWNYHRKAAKQRELYPELYELRDKASELNDQKIEYCGRKHDIKTKIDYLITQTKYATPNDKDKIDKELIDLRFELKEIEELKITPLRNQCDELWAQYQKRRTELENKGVKIY